ncbi:DUF4079 domain-containing protein [Oscillatoria sp. CS-180]|uniref:DUF4079 domain-containing protein n=1 Tax=Oscillatoria sp. CS-180 TaxID=3021720 RepID=UPI00232E7515|nr:DUF4079 domain-containing protein [Oscillatoria sp. CS-180]MDB9527343.1 DUF4079 domain-containing protein [Oscillatoria sp. CS-180]
MNLPSFLWLWKIAAWSMGLTLVLYFSLLVLGGLIRYRRLQGETVPPLPSQLKLPTLRRIHVGLGTLLVLAVLLLLTIGIVGTLGHFGNLGHSVHLPVGLTVVSLTLASAWSAKQINHPQKPWARSLHLTINGLLFLALALVSWSGWVVVQKYLP